MEEHSGEVIPLASVSAKSGGGLITVKSASDGQFEICSTETIDSLFFYTPGYEIRVTPVFDSGKYLLVETRSELSTVHVMGFRNDLTNAATPGSFGIIDKKTIQAIDQTSLMPALNRIPGVIMESRGYGGSHRISIRGSFLRSPFAVRNIKMYMNGIPLSSPDGSSPLEIPDAADVGGIEIIKGPAGSAWGSGNGGVMLFTAKRARPESITVGTSFTAGEYEWYRNNTFAEIDKGKWNTRLSYNWQENYGYREQEFNRKQQFSLFSDYKASDRLDYFIYATFYNGDWGLPGALNAQQVEENPRQAVPFSVEHNAMLWRERIFGGVSQQWRINRNWKNTTSIYYNTNDKRNPYGTSAFSNGYKIEGGDGEGGRTDFSFEKQWNKLFYTRINTGGEVQSEAYFIDEYENDYGSPGDFKYHYDVDYLQSMVFVTTDLKFTESILLNAGISSNFLRHDISGMNAGDFVFDSIATTTPDFLPRIALSIRLDSLLYLYGSAGTGNSNPTIFEQIAVQDGTFNQLDPEHGINLETGVKGQLLGIDFEISFYDFQLSNAILPDIDTTTDVSATTDLYYFNGGNTHQRGLEASGKYEFFRNQGSSLLVSASFTTTNYVFGDYVTEDTQLEGYRLPGVPLNTATGGLTVSFWKHRFELNVFEYWFDKIPLDNFNTTWSSAYHLLNARLDFRTPVDNKWSFNLFAGVNNIFNSEYTSFYQLNGAGGKYYNPAPVRNVYGGLKIQFKIRH